MPNGPGVSVKQLPNGRWRVRWRETVDEGDGPRVAQRERVVRDHATAILVQAKALRAIEAGEALENPAPAAPPARVASLDAVLVGWLRSRAAKGMAANTIAEYGERNKRILRAFRTMHRIPKDVPVRGSVLTRGEIDAFTLQLRVDGLSDGTVYGTVQSLLAAWTWASDDPDTYPGLAPPPRDKRDVLPRPVVYAAPPAATMAEIDAVLRILAARRNAAVAVPVTVIGRCSGLRVAQALAIRVGDVHLSECSLTVASGKSQREKAERRTVPMAPVLRDYLAPLVAGRDLGELVIRRRRDVTRNRNGPSRTLGIAWDEATRAGLARRETWDPPGRECRRPDHVMRAAFQTHLVEAGVRDEVIDALVGHAGKTTRGRHYAGPDARWEAMVEAVAMIPPIAWEAQKRVDNVVDLQARRRPTGA